ncbi:uncharacterized protein DDB_G0287625-like [Dermacentor albipictus]|uniref:uncharacterized protein DDB_G0287625-like n=1 Tax=Dermacentor albipictus TaxID=60249 RepID=UPI0038FCE655
MATRQGSKFASDSSARKKKAQAVAEAAPEAPSDDGGYAPPGHVGIEASARSETRDKLTQSRGVIQNRANNNCQVRHALSQEATIENNKACHRAETEGASIVLQERFDAEKATCPAPKQSWKNGIARRMHASRDRSSASASDTSRTGRHSAIRHPSSSSGGGHKRRTQKARHSSGASRHSRHAKKAQRLRRPSSRSGGSRLKRRTSRISVTSRSSSTTRIKRGVKRDRRSRSASSSGMSGHKRKTKMAQYSGAVCVKGSHRQESSWGQSTAQAEEHVETAAATSTGHKNCVGE